jgi:hypothetical protein
LLVKNILLACYRNPQPAEHLAIEMGIALPYMEDELLQLAQSTLMRQNGGKHETAIFIVSAEAQEACCAHTGSVAPQLADSIIKSAEYLANCRDRNGIRWHESYQPFEDMKWALLMRQTDALYSKVTGRHKPRRGYENAGHSGSTMRPYGGQWDLLGLEDCTTSRPPLVGLHGCGETPEHSGSGYSYQFGQYKYKYERIDSQTPDYLSPGQIHALVEVARKTPERAPAILLEDLTRFGYVRKEGGGLSPTFWVQFSDKLGDLTEDQEKTLSGFGIARHRIARIDILGLPQVGPGGNARFPAGRRAPDRLYHREHNVPKGGGAQRGD